MCNIHALNTCLHSFCTLITFQVCFHFSGCWNHLTIKQSTHLHTLTAFKHLLFSHSPGFINTLHSKHTHTLSLSPLLSLYLIDFLVFVFSSLPCTGPSFELKKKKKYVRFMNGLYLRIIRRYSWGRSSRSLRLKSRFGCVLTILIKTGHSRSCCARIVKAQSQRLEWSQSQ